MYPFNKAASLTVDDETPVESTNMAINGHYNHRQNGNSQQRSIVNNILSMSLLDDKWVSELGSDPKKRPRQCSWRGVTCVSRYLRHILMFLQLIALFPGLRRARQNGKRSKKRIIKYFMLFFYSVTAVLFNTYLLHKNIWLIQAYKKSFGLMHASTVSCIITGIKPMINAFIITLFTWKMREHIRLLKTLDAVDVCFRSAFHLSPPIALYKCVFFFITSIAFMIPFSFRIIEFFVTKQSLGTGLIQDMAFIIVPLLTVWNVIPLLYYDLFNRIVRFYCQILIKSLNKEHQKRHFSLKFYYEQFLRITNVQEAIGNVFNPFVLFSLAWSMLVLCLTIYFMTQPHSSLLEPITPEQMKNPDSRFLLTRSVHFTICWAAIQVVVAVLHISLICSTGMATNETTRQIVNAVLRIVPDANADLDRFQISCFVHKMSTQFMWGMTVWRAFPLERTTFFTLVSVIVTYSFLLLKLKENPAVMPITRAFIFHNVTYNSTVA
ncbi:unnamed protein product [Auanema sp. JU1783]|nr:unnamed protein product [Auanema sp. JU1783]